ncbi:uncharacterized protein KY384_000143 [Bacidia gigantensis]|uniref:uncharacterized protein n=1 Tax=Bacidia gigantensis TaxID=2732470 RepID=UPI001D044FAB|nr:uncharacterized protein KY384_000143 [Bacidia gigantensis]KAG8526150.1 hypothetical protein KY384_000143 [Bacidia gigantensis]
MAPQLDNGYVSGAAIADNSKTAVNGHTTKETEGNQRVPSEHTQSKEPLKFKGVLEDFEYFDVTPVIGREFKDVDITAWLKSPNSDDLIRDLAITVSQRGVVFFRAQNNLTDDLQKQLIQRLGELSGKPSTSGLHIHPVSNSGREHSSKDDEISVISSLAAKSTYPGSALDPRTRKQSLKDQWHSDITFEQAPSDFSALRLTELPKTGGGNVHILPSLPPCPATKPKTPLTIPPDTLWASGYELFDRISPPYQKFLEGLTATYAQPLFHKAASTQNFSLHPGPRGSPLNTGTSLEATHPVIRTNPVTGWKSVFAVGHHVSHINELTADESKGLLDWFLRLVVENHDLQVRHKWREVGDLAIWDNRSVYHAATPDYEGYGERRGHRVVGVGERPYLDPESNSRREALAEERIAAERN